MNQTAQSSMDWWGAIGFSLYFMAFSKSLDYILSVLFDAPPSLAYSLSVGVPMLIAFPLFVQKRINRAPKNKQIWAFSTWFVVALVFSITAYFWK